MKIQLLNVGRQKVNKIIEVQSMEEAYQEVDYYLKSSSLELHPVENDESLWDVVVGGFRTVGQLKVLKN